MISTRRQALPPAPANNKNNMPMHSSLRQTVPSRHRTSRYCQWLAAGLLVGIGGGYFSSDAFAVGDLHNQADYQANSISVGMGTSATAGALNPAGIGWGNDSDSQASTTRAGISQATINITDEQKQKNLTGKDATQTVAELNRNVATDKDSSGALQNKFDATRVQNEVDAQTQITQTFGQQAAQAIGTIAQNQAKKHKEQAQNLKEKAADQHNNLSHDERQALLAQAQTHSVVV